MPDTQGTATRETSGKAAILVAHKLRKLADILERWDGGYADDWNNDSLEAMERIVELLGGEP